MFLFVEQERGRANQVGEPNLLHSSCSTPCWGQGELERGGHLTSDQKMAEENVYRIQNRSDMNFTFDRRGVLLNIFHSLKQFVKLHLGLRQKVWML